MKECENERGGWFLCQLHAFFKLLKLRDAVCEPRRLRGNTVMTSYNKKNKTVSEIHFVWTAGLAGRWGM